MLPSCDENANFGTIADLGMRSPAPPAAYGTAMADAAQA
jgi:hypothetical protein